METGVVEYTGHHTGNSLSQLLLTKSRVFAMAWRYLLCQLCQLLYSADTLILNNWYKGVQVLALGLQQGIILEFNANFEVTTSAYIEVIEEMKIKVNRWNKKLFAIMKSTINITVSVEIDHPVTIISIGSKTLWEDTFVTSRDWKSKEQ